MLPDRDPEVLLARIDRLERRLAGITRLLSAGAALVGLGIVALLASQRSVVSAETRGAAPSELVATSLKLVDASGRPRAALYVDGQTAGLAISDPAGRTRVLLNTDGESTKLAITGATKGFPRIVLAQQGTLQMLNLENASTSMISLMHTDETPTLTLASQGNSAEIGIAEVFTRGTKPALTPRLKLEQGDRTLATLPAIPAR